MSWTDERVEQLKAMWAEGQSASQIAKTLGEVTRNAVIGKVHRLGLSNRTAKPATPAAEAPADGEAAPETLEPTFAEAAPPPAPAKDAAPELDPAAAEPEPEPAPKAASPTPKPVQSSTARREPPPPTPAMIEDALRTAETLAEVEKKARKLDLLELTERTCKWPIGDPATDDFFFCGLPCQGSKPYCENHVAVAFQPMSSRRDRERNRNRGAR